MSNLKTFFDSFKEFIWDIIGYLLPGSFLLILLSSCINQEYQFSTPLINEKTNLFGFVFMIVSYVLGHLIYGFGLLKEKVLGKYSYIKRIEKGITKRQAFNIAKELLKNALVAKGVSNDLDAASPRDIRNLAMSFIPEADQKIYTFTFRSELSNHSANICLMVGFIGLMFSIFEKIYIPLFVVDLPHNILYCVLVISYFLLIQTRNRFYAITIGLPFSIYSAKALQ